MAIRYISRLTGITLGDSGIKAQERQKIFVFDLKIPIFGLLSVTSRFLFVSFAANFRT